MKTWTSSFIALKNQLEGKRAWAHLVELQINANTTAFFTSHPDTVTHNNNTYMPVPMAIGPEEQFAGRELVRLNVDVWNYQGMAFRFAKDNDLSLNDVTIRFVNLTLASSGAEDLIKLKILGTAFAGEAGRFSLGLGITYDSEGPRRIWNRRDFPGIPVNMRQFGIL